MSNEEAWKYAIGITEGCTGKKVSADFMALVEKEKVGEITGEDIREALNKKYTRIEKIR
ncbi:MAG: hypothetical protein PHN38_09265 [Sulfurospirillaceae bacterium]|nr:hypothetical protein [Sulfurospirillaceae bacterium]